MSSPYLLMYKKAPDLQSLKIFGSAVFPWLRPYNANKLQPRSAICVFFWDIRWGIKVLSALTYTLEMYYF